MRRIRYKLPYMHGPGSTSDKTIRFRESSHSPTHTQEVGRRLIRRFGSPGRLFALSGELGTGKSELVRGMARELDIHEPVTSPTYAIINEYEGPVPLIHVDLYRISESEELELLDLWAHFSDAAIIAIEWAERIPASWLPGETIHVHIALTEDRKSGHAPASNERTITVSGGGIAQRQNIGDSGRSTAG